MTSNTPRSPAAPERPVARVIAVGTMLLSIPCARDQTRCLCGEEFAVQDSVLTTQAEAAEYTDLPVVLPAKLTLRDCAACGVRLVEISRRKLK